ncbi:MAG: hypothetical protein JWN84_4536 [Nocardioides sp.]|nr:hypothetical protein [Nocardioides sp.]
MLKSLRGLAVATVLSLAPLSAATVTAAPAQAVVATASTGSATSPAAEAPALREKARRTISVKDTPGRRARLRIFVRPAFGNKPLIIQTRKAGTFRTTGRVRTNANGVAIKVFASSRRGIRYRLIAKGGRDYATAAVSFTIATRFV